MVLVCRGWASCQLPSAGREEAGEVDPERDALPVLKASVELKLLSLLL